MSWFTFLLKHAADYGGDDDIPPNPKDPRRHLPNDGLYDALNEDKPQLGDRIFQHYGVWQYAFQMVKKDVTEGWYLDWFENPGSIHDFNQVQIGDQVADNKLNMTPYWEVSGLDESKGRIYVTPIGQNPWVTGIGAGGKELTEHDFQVQSGEYEQSRIDSVLDVINKKTYIDSSDVAYMLLGTVPVHNGPNGAQGGWYSLNDHHNRGAQQGMAAKEIMMKDAATLQKLGLAVPKAALDGTLPLDAFKYVFDGGLPYLSNHSPSTDAEHRLERKMLQIDGENFDDPEASKKMMLSHPQKSIKKRNWDAIKEKYHALPEEDRPTMRPFLKDLIAQFANVYHPLQEKLSKTYDPYEFIKEDMILMSMNNKWPELVRLFENSIDTGNRSEVMRAYAGFGMFDDIIRLEEKETHPEVLRKILGEFYSHKKNGSKLIDRNPEKYRQAIDVNIDDIYGKYHAEELSKTPVWAIDIDKPEEMEEFFGRRDGVLLSVKQYLEQKFASASNWLKMASK